MSTAAGDLAITWGLRAAMNTGRADERRPRSRITRATAVATTVETARRGADTPAPRQAGLLVSETHSPKTIMLPDVERA